MADEKRSESEITLPIGDFPRARLYEAMHAFHEVATLWLWGRKGDEAREYLTQSRALSVDLLRDEGVGYIPPSADNSVVVRAMTRLDYLPEELVAVGLANRDMFAIRDAFRRAHRRDAAGDAELTEFFGNELINRAEMYRDFFAFNTDEGWRAGDCVFLPYRVRCEDGEIRVVSGKARGLAPGAAPKYKLMRQTAIFNQRDHLVGVEGFEQEAQAWGEAFMVEGEIDRLALIQALRDDFYALPVAEREGMSPSHPPVGLMGTSTMAAKISNPPAGDESSDERRIRAGSCAPLIGCRVIQFLDEDKTGLKQATRNAQLISSIGCQVHIARPTMGMGSSYQVPAGKSLKDVSDLLVLGGVSAVRRAHQAAHRHDIIDIAIELYEAKVAESPERERTLRSRSLAARDFVDALLCVPPERRSLGISRVAKVLDLEDSILVREIARRELPAQATSPAVPVA